MKRIAIFLVATIVMLSCTKETPEYNFNDMADLPEDTGGTHTPVFHGTTDAPYGHYIYLPSGYDERNEAEYPLVLFLHGAGEKGNSNTNPQVLQKVLVNGPPKLIENGTWPLAYPKIVVSPQCHESAWSAIKIHEMIEYLTERYRINKARVYLTGLSMGGYGTFNYLTTYGNEGYVTAAVPICGSGNKSLVNKCTQIPIWAFHGEDDLQVDKKGSIDFIKAYNSQQQPIKYKALLTIYPDVGHDSWTMTYDGTGMGSESLDYDVFNISIYDWMLKYKRKPFYNE